MNLKQFIKTADNTGRQPISWLCTKQQARKYFPNIPPPRIRLAKKQDPVLRRALKGRVSRDTLFDAINNTFWVRKTNAVNIFMNRVCYAYVNRYELPSAKYRLIAEVLPLNSILGVPQRSFDWIDFILHPIDSPFKDINKHIQLYLSPGALVLTEPAIRKFSTEYIFNFLIALRQAWEFPERLNRWWWYNKQLEQYKGLKRPQTIALILSHWMLWSRGENGTTVFRDKEGHGEGHYFMCTAGGQMAFHPIMLLKGEPRGINGPKLNERIHFNYGPFSSNIGIWSNYNDGTDCTPEYWLKKFEIPYVEQLTAGLFSPHRRGDCKELALEKPDDFVRFIYALDKYAQEH